MSIYFGQCNANGTLIEAPAAYDYGGPAWVGNVNSTYTAPAGLLRVDSLAIYGRTLGGAGNVNCALYDSGWNRVCQWDAEAAFADDTPAWLEKVAANLTGTLIITGGAQYHFAYGNDAEAYPGVGVNTGSEGDWAYEYPVDYTGGFPATLSAPTQVPTGGRAIMRCGVTLIGAPVVDGNVGMGVVTNGMIVR